MSSRPQPPRGAREQSRAPSHSVPQGFIPGIDPLRGLVCLCVLSLHSGDDWARSLHPDGLSAFALRPGVESFLVLSGFFLTHSFRPAAGTRLSVRQFVVRRLLRLAVPFWVAVLLLSGLTLARDTYAGHPPAAVHFLGPLSQLFFVNDLAGFRDSQGFYWSIVTLFQYYLIWTALFWVVRGVVWRSGLGQCHETTMSAMGSLSWAAAVAGLVVLVGVDNAALHWRLPYAAVYLATGSIVCRAARGAAGARTALAFLVLLACVGVATANSRPVWAAVTGGVLYYLARPGHSWTRIPRTGWLAAVGQWSFSIYLVHGIAQICIECVGRRLGQPVGWHASAAYVLVAIPVSVFAGFLFYRAVERPMARAAGRVRYRQASEAAGSICLPSLPTRPGSVVVPATQPIRHAGHPPAPAHVRPDRTPEPARTS